MSDTINKSNRIASAIYLITGFFGDNEPLKWKLRSLSADLVSLAVRDKTNTVKDMLALFSVAKNAGLVSDVNHDIIFKELSKFEKEVEKPLELAFPSETLSQERILPAPEKAEPIKDMPEIDSASKPVLKDFGAVSVKKNSRQSIIISILKRKKEVMIKDVVPLIKGCGEKTIQRELMAMVNAGVLKKVGEKRWSRYTLA